MSDLLELSQEQRFRLLVSAITDYAIYMLDPSGRIATWNRGAERFKGYSAEEIIGQHFSRFFTPEDIAKGLPAEALKAAARDGRYEAEGWRVRKDGSRFWVNAVIDAIFDEDGRHIGFAKVIRDITDRKQAEDELASAREALVQSQKLQALGELTGGIAHDFNNLMTVIAGSADFLLKNPDQPAEKRIQYLKAIAETAERATSLTDHLLAFGRRQAVKPIVLDLGVRLDAFAEMIARTLGSQIIVKLEARAENAMVEADPAQLETALLNAALNARDAMPSGGELTIVMTDTKLDGSPAISIELQDTGTGISKADMARVFEPFFTTKEIGKGTGLGLSQIHGFAAQAGGRAEIRSIEGEGTTVSIILPRTRKKPAKAASKNRSAQVPEGVRILLVEDNDGVREFAAALLRDLKCEVETACNGAEALEKARSGKFDVILSDVVMPAMDGLELAERIAAEQPHVPVILATGFSKQLADRGSTNFTVVAKPFDGSSLSQAIAAVIKGSEA